MNRLLFLAFFLLALAVCQNVSAVEYTGKAYDDPFLDTATLKPKGNPAEASIVKDKKILSELTIQGIMVSPDGSMAIVNGKVAKEGGLLQGFRVIAIEPDGMTLEGQSRQIYKLPHKKKGVKT